MKNMILLHWMEDIDPELIARTDSHVPVRRHTALRVLLIAAAAVLLLAVMLTASSLLLLDSYTQQNFNEYDGTVLHALDFVLTIDDNAFANMLGEQNRRALHSVFDTLRGVTPEPKPDPESDLTYSRGLEFQSLYSNGTCFVTGLGSCKDLHVVIPEISPEGHTVTGIAPNAFENCPSITKVTIPDTVTVIHEGAFRDCTKLETIHIPKSVTLIGPEAFMGCWRLQELHISESVVSIGSGVVGKCFFMEALTVDPENEYYYSINNCLIETESGKLIGGCGTSVIPSGVVEIAPYAFYCSSELESIVVPEGVERIGEAAFLGCTSLRKVSLPASLQSIEKQAFAECTLLGNVSISEGLVKIGEAAFAQCGNLDGVTLPSTLKELETGAFRDCTSLTEIHIPSGIESVRAELFSGCTSLVRVELPDSVTIIWGYAFYMCKALTDIEIPSGVLTIGTMAFCGCQSLPQIHLPEGLKSIGNNTFQDCDALTEIAIPSTMTTIPARAFADADSLLSLRVPDTIYTIDEYAFGSCDALQSVYIPASVTNLGDNVFLNCNVLTELEVAPDNPKYISRGNCLIHKEFGKLLFANSHSQIPSGVTIIGSEVFEKTDVKSVTLPEGVTTIEYSAFYYADELKSIIIPASVLVIDDYAFYYCFSLTHVYFTGTKQEWEAIAVGDHNEDLLEATIHFEYKPDVYDPVLTLYKELLENPEIDPETLEARSEEEFFLDLYEVACTINPYKAGFAARDLNGDQIPELLLLDKAGVLYAVYTQKDGKPMAVDYFSTDNHRGGIDADGMIYKESHGKGESWELSITQILQNGDLDQLVFGVSDPNPGQVEADAYLYRNGAEESVDIATVQALYEQYAAHVSYDAPIEIFEDLYYYSMDLIK